MSSAVETSTPTGPGSVSGAPNLPARFADTFTSRYVDAGEVRLHAVVGGAGPPLLLIHGWPGGWYYWRLVSPARAEVSTGDKAAGADVIRSMAERAGATITEVEGSHVVMVSQPGAVADVVLTVAAAVRG